MPVHDAPTAVPEFEGFNEAEAERVEAIAKTLAEHLYARPMTSEQDELDDNTLWEYTSEENKRIFRAAAIDVFQNHIRRREDAEAS